MRLDTSQKRLGLQVIITLTFDQGALGHRLYLRYPSVHNVPVLISVIIPAFNEEAYLGKTLTSVYWAKVLLQSQSNVKAEIIVVDNNSDDSTANVARALGAAVVTEAERNVAKVRNSGAKLSQGDVLVFIDADTVVPDRLLVYIAGVMSDELCFGGAVDTEYRPKKVTIRAYLQLWRILGRLMGMAQGATQFCRRELFFELNGYDENLFMGEDVDFYWRLNRMAKRQSAKALLIDEVKVLPSTRRFDQWPLWRTLVWTNPLIVLLFRRSGTCWKGWYDPALRTSSDNIDSNRTA